MGKMKNFACVRYHKALGHLMMMAFGINIIITLLNNYTNVKVQYTVRDFPLNINYLEIFSIFNFKELHVDQFQKNDNKKALREATDYGERKAIYMYNI